MMSAAKSKKEFLTDQAFYFLDKPDTYLDIKQEISDSSAVPFSLIRICGSAYWGESFMTGKKFEPGRSDLDVALISERLYVQCLSEVRAITFNFTNLTKFPKSPLSSDITFRDYAYKKGIVRLDLMPQSLTKTRLSTLAGSLSTKYASIFGSVNFMIYDSEESFVVKQINAVEKYRV